MKETYKRFLFEHHILVNDGNPEDDRCISETDQISVAMALAGKFGIRIRKGIRLANTQMIRDAERYLGEYVPEPFYRGFPASVLEMTPDQRLCDQLLHYTETYGLGWFDEPGHSMLETIGDSKLRDVFDEKLVPEHVEPKDFDILSESKAIVELKKFLGILLSANRPLNLDQLALVEESFTDFGADILPPAMPCKDTVIRLLYDFGNLYFCRYLKLSDTIKLLNYIQYTQYNSENLKKLNLKNRDRKIITRVINWFFDKTGEELDHYVDQFVCFEKRKIWCGLLHHIHYKPVNDAAQRFTDAIRSGPNISHFSAMERYMNAGRPVDAAKYICATKGSGTLLRNMNYILSRCHSEREIKEVFKCLESTP